MLITDYLVGSDEEGRPLCLVVKDVLPLDCQPGRTDLVQKMNRQDLVQEFVQDGLPVDWVVFPDLPQDVIELLQRGDSLKLIDKAEAEVMLECFLTKDSGIVSTVGIDSERPSKVGML